MVNNSVRRYNILMGSWVITAANRINRPWQGAQTEEAGGHFQKRDEINQLAPGGIRADGKVSILYSKINDYRLLPPI